MGSLQEQIKGIDKRISIDTKEKCVLEITHNGSKVGELMIGISKCKYCFSSGESEIDLYAVNAKTIDGKITSVHYSI